MGADRDATNATRREVRPEILEVLGSYLRSAIRLEEELKALLAKPKGEVAAAAALRSFVAYLQSARAGGPPGSKLPQDGRLRFFASSFWHVQEPEEWPPFYESARAALAADGLYDSTGLDVADDYLAFRKAFLQLQKALELASWDLESLLRWTQRDDAVPVPTKPDEDEPEEATTGRVWLIALGRNADQWEACHRDGVIAIGWNGLGDLLQYPSLDAIRAKLREDDADPMNAGLACWQFAHHMQRDTPVQGRVPAGGLLGELPRRR